MRTTLDIDDDVLAMAKELAQAERKTVGSVISELVRKAVTSPPQQGFADDQAAFEHYGWHVLPNRSGAVVTPELVEQILEEIDEEDAAIHDYAKPGSAG